MENVTKRYRRTREAADYLRLSPSFLEKLRVAGGGPAYISAGRAILYDVHDLDAWAALRRRDNTSQPAPSEVSGTAGARSRP